MSPLVRATSKTARTEPGRAKSPCSSPDEPLPGRFIAPTRFDVPPSVWRSGSL